MCTSGQNLLTFHIFGLIERIHCLRLVEPPASTSPSSTGAETWKHCFISLFTSRDFLCYPPVRTVQVSHHLTYTWQFLLIKIHSCQSILKHKWNCHARLWSPGGTGVHFKSLVNSLLWSEKKCERCSPLSGKRSWGQWRTRNMILVRLLW